MIASSALQQNPPKLDWCKVFSMIFVQLPVLNNRKSIFLAFKNISRVKKDEFTSIVGFNHTMHLGKCLGFPSLCGRVKKSDFSYITKSTKNKLAGWKMTLLKQGR